MFEEIIEDSHINLVDLILNDFQDLGITSHKNLRQYANVHMHEAYFNSYFITRDKSPTMYILFKLLDVLGYDLKIQTLHQSLPITSDTYMAVLKDLLKPYRRKYLVDTGIVPLGHYPTIMNYYPKRNSKGLLISSKDVIHILTHLNSQLIFKRNSKERKYYAL